MATTSVEQRFLAKFEQAGPNDCWEWQAGRIKDGYGRFSAPEDHLAHRFAYRRAFGSIPPGFQVLHRCDNPPCVNPAHLFLGSQAENVADMWSKGRAEDWSTSRRARGLANRNGKLADEQVREIRTRYASGASTQAELALEYCVAQKTVSLIVRRKSHAYLDDHQAI